MGEAALRSRIRLRYVEENCSTHGSIPAHFIPIQLMGTKLQLPTGESTELKTQCRLQERGKGAVKHTVCSMQALRPLRHNDPLQLKLSTWLRSLCPGRLLWSRSSGASTSCAALPAAFPVPRPTPRHCSSTAGHSAAAVTSGPCCEGAHCTSHGTSLLPTAQGSDRLHCRMLLARPASPLLCHSSCHGVQQHSCLKDMSLKLCIVLCQRWAVMSAGGRADSPEQ